MSEFTNTGVVTKTLDEWYESVVAFKQSVWGENFVTDPTTKQGADILQLAELLYNAEMNNVSAFAQLNLNTATGICLDYIGLVRGIARDGGFPQQITVDLVSATIGYTLTPSIIFKTASGYTYYSPSNVQITNINQQVVLTYSSDGNPDVNAGEPLQTVAPYTNIISATIAQGGIVPGAETESDSSYRKRIKNTDIGFIGTLELMVSEMLKIQGLSKLKILYNDTSSTDVNNIPAYATEFLVVPEEGVDDTTFNRTVAQKILDIKVPGAPLYGSNTSISISDYYGEPKTVDFTRPTKQTLRFYAQIAANPETNIIDTSNVGIETQAIVDYVQSVDVGTPISWSRILGIIASDPGYMIVDWGIWDPINSQWVKTDVSCGVREYFWIDSYNIDISTTASPN